MCKERAGDLRKAGAAMYSEKGRLKPASAEEMVVGRLVQARGADVGPRGNLHAALVSKAGFVPRKRSARSSSRTISTKAALW